MGLGTRTSLPHPTYLVSLQGIPVMQIACGAYHSMVLTVSGNIFAFGKNEYERMLFAIIDELYSYILIVYIYK